jgi:hypothetical protein
MEGCSLLAVLARRVNNFTAVTWKGFVYRFKAFDSCYELCKRTHELVSDKIALQLIASRG